MDTQSFKKIIKIELPILIKKDKKIRDWILKLAREEVAGKTDKILVETGSKFDLIMEELRRDREAQSKKWEEQNKKWEEQNKKWDAQEKKWDEQNKKWEELKREDKLKWDAQNKKWEEDKERWEEFKKEMRLIHEKVDKNKIDTERLLMTTVGALGARWGLRSEASFRNALKGILTDQGITVEHIDEFDDEGIVFGWPSSVELDIIIKNGSLMICELKSSMSKADIFTFYKKALFYEKKYQRKGDRFIVITPMIDKNAQVEAEKFGIKVYTYIGDFTLDS